METDSKERRYIYEDLNKTSDSAEIFVISQTLLASMAGVMTCQTKPKD